MLNTILYYHGLDFEKRHCVYFVAYDPGPTGRMLGKFHFPLKDNFTIDKGIKWVADRFPEYNLIPYDKIKSKEIYKEEH